MGLEVFNPFAGLLGDKTRQDSWRWGTVVSENPVRVRLDGDSEPSLATPDCLVPVTTGDRVRVQIANRRMTVFGKLPTAGDGNTIWVNGNSYQRTGTVAAPSYSFSGTTNSISYATVSVPVPYDPPPNWTFKWSVAEADRWLFLDNSTRFPTNGRMAVRLIQISNTDPGHLKRLQWELVYSGV